MALRDPRPWLCQGDVFQILPQIDSELDFARDVRPRRDVGPALLITHDCDLDKPLGNMGPPRIERLQFLPLRDVTTQIAQRQALVRAREVQPPEPIYVGDVAGVGEAFGLLGEAFHLPAAYFDLALQEFPDDPDAEAGARYLVARAHGNRVGRLDEVGLDLLWRKITVFYSRGDPGPSFDYATVPP